MTDSGIPPVPGGPNYRNPGGAPVPGVPSAVGSPTPGAPVPGVPAPPRSAIAPGSHRLHKVVIFKWTVSIALPILIGVLASALPLLSQISESLSVGTGAMTLLLVVIVVVCVVFGLIIALLSYRNFTWELTDTELLVKKGIIFKKRSQIPFTRIHAIDTEAKVLDRILGIVTLNVQTAGSSAPEAVIGGLALSDAEALRAELFARRHLASSAPATTGVVEGVRQSIDSSLQALDASLSPAAGGGDVMGRIGRVSDSVRGAFGGSSYIDDEPVTFEYRLTAKEIFLAALTGDSTVIMLFTAIGGILSSLGSMGIDMRTVEQGMSIAAGSGPALIVALIFFVVIVCLVIWIFAIIGSMISCGGFIVRRRGDRLEVEQGLLQHRFNGIALSRVQSVVIRRGLIRRAFGYAEVVVSTVSNVSDSSNSKDQHTGTIIHPFIRYADVPAFVGAALPEFAGAPMEPHGLPIVARRRSFNRLALWPFLILAGLSLIVYLFLPTQVLESGTFIVWRNVYLAAFVVCFLFQVLRSRLWFTHAGLSHDDRMLMLQKGALNMEIVYIPRRKIQWARVSANPFQRWAGVETLRAATAAGERGTRNILRDVETTEADDIIDWIRPGHMKGQNHGR